MSETVFAQATAFPQIQQALRQTLADAFGVVVGVVVVRRGGQGGLPLDLEERSFLPLKTHAEVVATITGNGVCFQIQ